MSTSSGGAHWVGGLIVARGRPEGSYSRSKVHRQSALLSRIASTTLFLSAVVTAQTFDFEDRIPTWSRKGEAFRDQPYCDPIRSTAFVKSPIGGDYWKDLKYPLGHNGKCLVSTIFKAAGTGISSLTSPDFTLKPEAPFFSLRIGGTRDPKGERVELQLRVPAGAESALLPQLRAWWKTAPDFGLPDGEPQRDGDYLIAGAVTGNGLEVLRQVNFELPKFLWDRTARIRVLDDSPAGHINLDLVQFTQHAPPPLRTPVWGVADYHTHPMSYLAFGGLKDRKTLFGSPGGNVEDYYNPQHPRAVSEDIGHCVTGHGGGSMAEPFINESQLMRYTFVSIIKSFLVPHKHRGGPEFDNFPAHLMGAHQQMHITGIRRSYEGGLRLMVALATDNMAAQFLTAKVKNGHIELAREQESMEKQLTNMKTLVAQNSKWMEIAYSSADARSIIGEDKLAVVLGVEFDQLGELGLSANDALVPRLEAEYLWGLGARAVVPIHAVNNKLGGPAVFIEPYNWLNDLVHRTHKDATVAAAAATQPQYFEIDRTQLPCDTSTRGQCVLGRLKPFPELRVAIGHPLGNLFRPTPAIFSAPPVTQYATDYGHKNIRGLENFGKRYIQALMNRGLIVDTSHMSDRSVEDTFGEIGNRLKRQHPGCDTFSFWTDAPPECNADAYPAIISHAHFRGQAFMDDTAVNEFLPSEYDISDRNLEMVSRVGGVVGPFIAEPRIDPASSRMAKPIPADCGNSSKNFAHSFHYAATAINTPADTAGWASRVGLATDMTFIPMVSPRFGPNGCDGWVAYNNGAAERKKNPQRYTNSNMEEVLYCRDPRGCGQDGSLKPYVMDKRTFDFNYDGLAGYALLPDMLQDLKRLHGQDNQDMETLFQSAEGYLQMWQKVERLSGVLAAR